VATFRNTYHYMMMMMMMNTSAFKENNSHDAKRLLAEKHSHVPFFTTNHTCTGLYMNVYNKQQCTVKHNNHIVCYLLTLGVWGPHNVF